MTDVLSDKIKEEIISKIPMKRVGRPAEIAKLAVFLASEDSNYITGQVINVDGGMVM
jgi:3-oxoacyl-[acyl-carrier protein] reductase